MEVPEESLGGGNDVPGQQGYAQQSGMESDSSTNWQGIIFLILWMVAFLLYVMFFFLLWQTTRNTRGTAPASQVPNSDETAVRPTGDVEAQTAEGDDKTSMEPIRRAAPSTLMIWIPTVAAAIAFSLSVVPHASCKFLSVNLDGRDGGRFQSLGLWSNEAYDKQCYSNFRTADFVSDTPLLVARIAGILSSLLGGICLIIFIGILVLVLLRTTTTNSEGGGITLRNRSFWILLATSLLIVVVAQTTTLSLLGTDYCANASSCNLDFGGSLASVTATAYWFLCFLAVLAWRP